MHSPSTWGFLVFLKHRKKHRKSRKYRRNDLVSKVNVRCNIFDTCAALGDLDSVSMEAFAIPF